MYMYIYIYVYVCVYIYSRLVRDQKRQLKRITQNLLVSLSEWYKRHYSGVLLVNYEQKQSCEGFLQKRCS